MHPPRYLLFIPPVRTPVSELRPSLSSWMTNMPLSPVFSSSLSYSGWSPLSSVLRLRLESHVLDPYALAVDPLHYYCCCCCCFLRPLCRCRYFCHCVCVPYVFVQQCCCCDARTVQKPGKPPPTSFPIFVFPIPQTRGYCPDVHHYLGGFYSIFFLRGWRDFRG